MRRRITLLAALAVLVACSQEDQALPFESEPGKPVTSTMGSGNTTVSTPDGISLTVPAGALPAGTEITVVKLDRTVGQELPGAVGDAYIVGFDGVPTSGPSISFSSTLDQEATAGQIVGMVPVVMRVGSPGTSPAGNLSASRFRSPPVARADVAGTSAQKKFEALVEAGIFSGSATIQDDMTRHQFAYIIAQLQDLDTTPPAIPPLFEDATDPWYLEAIMQANAASFTSSFNPGVLNTSDVLSYLDVLAERIDVEGIEAFSEYIANGGSVYMISNFLPASLPAYEITDLPSSDTASNRLIPSGSSSATFTLLCTGIQWPGTSDVPTCSENTVDVRVGPELLSRFPVSVVVPNYLFGHMTLDLDGSASGQVEYEAYLRSALSSGITGVGRKGSFDLDGTWSVSGDTITFGDYSFLYTIPDAESLILSISDSVQIEDNDGTKSWQPVQANVKLTRQQ